jgi:hypothetical protein
MAVPKKREESWDDLVARAAAEARHANPHIAPNLAYTPKMNTPNWSKMLVSLSGSGLRSTGSAGIDLSPTQPVTR